MRLLKGHKKTVRQLVYAPDGKRMLSGGEDGKINLWDLAAGGVLCSFRPGMKIFAVAFHPGGELFAVGVGSEIVLYDLDYESFLPSLRMPHTVLHLSFSPGGEYLAASDWLRAAWCWKIATRQELGERASFPCHGVWSIRFAPTGQMLAVGVEGRPSVAAPLLVFNAPDGREVCRLPQKAVTRLAFSPDGALLATLARGSKVATLWDLRRGEKLADLRGHTENARDIAFSPDGRHLLTGSKDGTICFWDVPTRSEKRSFNWQLGEINTVAFAPDGMTAAAGGEKGIMVFDVDG
jgi:WD40 repeat protein